MCLFETSTWAVWWSCHLMSSITKFLERNLKLKVNRTKSAVAKPSERKFLGYTVTIERKARLKPASESVKWSKDRIRQITGQRARGRNIQGVIEELNTYLRGWFNYFRLAEVKQSFDILDHWIRRRLRKLMWRHWKKPKTRYKKMVQLGVKADRAKKAAADPGTMRVPHTCTLPSQTD